MGCGRPGGPRVRRRPSGVKQFLCDNCPVVAPRRPLRACTLAVVTAILVAAEATAGWAAPALLPELPLATLQRLSSVTERASVAARVDGPPFQARRDVLEYLLDHPDFAAHLMRTVRAARYRIWAVPGGFGIDDGWGTVGTFEFVYAAPGIRVLHARGEYQQRMLPDIRGEAIITLTYATTPAATDGRSRIAAAVSSHVRLDGPLLRAAGRVAGGVAQAKAEKEGVRLVKTLARATRAVDDNPAAVWEALRRRPDVPRRELEEFRRLLNLPRDSSAAARP